MEISEERIDKLIETVENLRGAIKALTDELFGIREALSKPPKPATTGMLETLRREHSKLHPKNKK
jgi:hypothetical protein